MGFRKEVHIRRWGRSKPLIEIFPEWMDFWNLDVGDQVVEFGDTVIIVVPKEMEEIGKKIVSLFPDIARENSIGK